MPCSATAPAPGLMADSRRPVVYARGLTVPADNGKTTLVLIAQRPIGRGRYTLTTKSRHGGRSLKETHQLVIVV